MMHLPDTNQAKDTLTLEELKQIADVVGVTFEQSFILPNGEQIKTSNE